MLCSASRSQIDGLVPVDDVAGEGEGLDVDDVHVAALGADVEPLALKRQVEAGDPVVDNIVLLSLRRKRVSRSING